MNTDLSHHLTIDSSKVRIELGYEAIVSDHDALESTIEWQLANPPEVETFDFDYDAEDAVLEKL